MRSETNKATDQKYFKNTANKIKTMNLPKKALRGGIRL